MRILLTVLLCLLGGPVMADEPIEKRLDLLFGDHEKHLAFFQEFKDSVVGSEKDKVANLVQYPLNVFIGGKQIVVPSKGELLIRYHEVFNENVVRTVKSQEAKDLFANWQGVMLGNGQVWFGGICGGNEKAQKCTNMTIKIIAVNTEAPGT